MTANGNVDEKGKKGRISFIAAIGAHDRSLGKDNDLVWKIPADMERFRAITKGHPILMGRKTWESIPHSRRPLPDRVNIVVTRQDGYVTEDALVAHSLEEALQAAEGKEGAEEVFVIGGGELFKEALSVADKLYLTLIDAVKDADSFFPEYETQFTKETFREKGVSPDGIKYTYMNLER